MKHLNSITRTSSGTDAASGQQHTAEFFAYKSLCSYREEIVSGIKPEDPARELAGANTFNRSQV